MFSIIPLMDNTGLGKTLLCFAKTTFINIISYCITSYACSLCSYAVCMHVHVPCAPMQCVSLLSSRMQVYDYIKEQFDAYRMDETALNRQNIQDNRVHCCLYFISPFGHG